MTRTSLKGDSIYGNVLIIDLLITGIHCLHTVLIVVLSIRLRNTCQSNWNRKLEE